MKPTGLVSGNSLRNKIGNEVVQVGHARKDWEFGMNLSMYDSNPIEGAFIWQYWDAVYDKADANKIKLLARFTTDTHFQAWSRTVPAWIQADSDLYFEASNNPANEPQHRSFTTRVPRYANPRVRANRKAFLKAFHDRYQNRPSFWKVDASLGGFSGEGHTASNGFQNAQFDMRGSWRWDYLADYVEVFGAENVVMIANQDTEGITKAVDAGIIYYRRDGIGAPYQMKELESWRTGVDGFQGALDRGGLLAEPWDQLKLWPGNSNVQQDFMLTAVQLVKLNCILFFNMDQEIPQQFIDNGFWPYLTTHFAEVNQGQEPAPIEPPAGDGGGTAPDEYQFHVEVYGGQVKRVVYGGSFETIELPDYDVDQSFVDEEVIPIPIVNGQRWNPRVEMRSTTGSDEWVIDPEKPDGQDLAMSFHCQGRDEATVTFDGYHEPAQGEYVTKEEFGAYWSEAMARIVQLEQGKADKVHTHEADVKVTLS